MSEVRPPEGSIYRPRATPVNARSTWLLTLIKHLLRPFVAEDFHDSYVEELEKSIEAKAKGKKPLAKAAKLPAKN
jgi:non-homologous end joining protein Ku